MSAAVASSPVFSPSRASVSLPCLSPPKILDCSPSSNFRLRSRQPRESLITLRPAVEVSPSPLNHASRTSLLKRKRPAMIDIPTAEEAARFPPPPPSDGRSEVKEEGEVFSVFCKRGRKKLVMEDRHAAVSHLVGQPDTEFFGIFDGHGGPDAAEFAAGNLANNIEYHGLTEDVVRAAYMKTDTEFLKSGEARGGASVVTALMSGRTLIVSNAGDCRAVVSRRGAAEALTSDHRPSRWDERDRIEGLDGFVDCGGGGEGRRVWRLQGRLAVSRGIGDAHLKKWVIAEPESRTVELTSEHEFLILASDGLWDKVGNQEAVDIVADMEWEKPSSSSLAACRKLAELSAMRGSMDDISVMVVSLRERGERGFHSRGFHSIVP